MQIYYIDQATDFFKEFIKLRNFTAEEYVVLIGKYPKFWDSVRKETEKVKYRKAEIEEDWIFTKAYCPVLKGPMFVLPSVVCEPEGL